jgi:ABC-type lipoprotein release transport system permease subunit
VPVVDPVALVTVPVLLTAAVLLACYFPSRRAAAADPMDVLRQL